MQVVVVVVDKVRRIFRVLHKSLDGIFREELSIWLGYSPEEFSEELAWVGRVEEVHLAVECIESLV
jgi:hypothetical protein